MIAFLINEKEAAKNLPKDQKKLYNEVFRSKGMTPVDFMHLMSIGKKFTAAKGEKIVRIIACICCISC